MKRKLIIEGNAVYEIDEECMVKQCIENKEEVPEQVKQKSEQESYSGKVEK